MNWPLRGVPKADVLSVGLWTFTVMVRWTLETSALKLFAVANLNYQLS